MRVLIVLTSHDQLGNTGRKTGFWLEELAAPYYVFKDADAAITLASPKGGQPPLDPKSNEPSFQTDQTRRFEADPVANTQLAQTVRLDSVRQEDFDTVFYTGGHGPLWELLKSQGMQENQQVVFLSDGGDTVRQLQEYLHPPANT
jgi:putative intracellular protease/amidase